MRREVIAVAGILAAGGAAVVVLMLAGVGSPPSATLSPTPPAAASAGPPTPGPTPGPTVAGSAGPVGPGPYYEAFRFQTSWVGLPEGQPIALPVSRVIDAYGKGGGFFQLVGGTMTVTKLKTDRYLTSSGLEGDCARIPYPCYRFRLEAQFTLHHLHEDGNLVAVPRWCATHITRRGGIESYFNSTRDASGCPNDANPSFLRLGGWAWMSWSGGGISPVTWRTDNVTYARPQHEMEPTVGFELRAAAYFACDAEAEWTVAREQPQPVEELGQRPFTERDLRLKIEEWAELVAKAETTTDKIAQETIQNRYPDLYDNLDEIKELVSVLRDLADATSPEATDAKKAELLKKYTWEAAKKILGYLNVSTVILDAIEMGYDIGTPIGERLAEGCATVTLIALRNQAQLGYQERFGSTVTTEEYEYNGRRFRRLADGTFEVRIAGDPVGIWRDIPLGGVIARREPLWLPLPH